MLVALDSRVSVEGADGKRVIPLDKFFTLPADGNIRRENVLKNDEIITQIHVPASPVALRSAYVKFKERETMDFALVSAAAALQIGPNQSILKAVIVLGGVAPIPWRVSKAEAFLVGKTLSLEVLQEAGKLALQDAQPLEKNEYKIPLAQTIVRRALVSAANPVIELT